MPLLQHDYIWVLEHLYPHPIDVVP